MQLKNEPTNWTGLALILVLIAVFVGVPIPIITYLYVVEKNATIVFAQKEIYGTDYLVPLKAVAKEMGRHRDFSNTFLRGSTGAQR